MAGWQNMTSHHIYSQIYCCDNGPTQLIFRQTCSFSRLVNIYVPFFKGSKWHSVMWCGQNLLTSYRAAALIVKLCKLKFHFNLATCLLSANTKQHSHMHHTWSTFNISDQKWMMGVQYGRLLRKILRGDLIIFDCMLFKILHCREITFFFGNKNNWITAPAK